MKPHQRWIGPAFTLLTLVAFVWRKGMRARHDRIDLEIARSALREEGSIGLDELMRKYG